MRESISLHAMAGPLEGEVIDLPEPDVFVVGRASDCPIRLPEDDPEASRHHFLLEVRPPTVTIRDLGSLNGTFVNGDLIGSRAPDESPESFAARQASLHVVTLHDGDEIRIGRSRFRLSVVQPAYCPQCGRQIPGGTARDHALRDDPRCDDCRAGVVPRPAPVAGSPPVPGSPPAPVAGSPPERGAGSPPPEAGPPAPVDDSERRDPVIALVRQMLEQRGIHRRSPEGAPEIAGYRIGPMIGKGGMGAVYRATRVADGQVVAVKVMLAERSADEQARWMFEREVTMQQRLSDHPNCVPVFDWDMQGTVSYFVMEFCPGGSLDGLIARRGGRLRVDEAAPLMLGALEGLVFAHSQDVVHRDLKPQNVLLTDPQGGAAKLTDFGLSKDFALAGLSGPLGTTTGAIGGSPAYLPRDQVMDFRFAGPVADVWGIAATFYNLLTGELVRDFPGNKDPIGVILSTPPVPIRVRLPSLPSSLAVVIDRALDDDPTARYPTAAAFRDALAAELPPGARQAP